MKTYKYIIITLLSIAYINSEAQVLNGEFRWETRTGEDQYNSGFGGLVDIHAPFLPYGDYDLGADDDYGEALLHLLSKDDTQPYAINNFQENFYSYNCAMHIAGDQIPGADLCVRWETEDNELGEVDKSTYPGHVFVDIDGNVYFDAAVGGVFSLTYEGFLIDNQLNPTTPQTHLELGFRLSEKDGPEKCECILHNNGITDQSISQGSVTVDIDGANVNKLHKLRLGFNDWGGASFPPTAAAIVDLMYTFVHGKSLTDPLEFGQLNYATPLTHTNNSYDPNAGNQNPHFSTQITESVSSTFYSFTVPQDGANVSVYDSELSGFDYTTFQLYKGNTSISVKNQTTLFGSVIFFDLCPGETYRLKVSPTLIVGFERPTSITINASPTSACLEDIDYSYDAGDFKVDFGVPDQTSCATNQQPWKVYNGTFNEDDFADLTSSVNVQNYHVLDAKEDFLGSIFVDFEPVIGSTKMVNVYHYRQKLGTDQNNPDGLGSDEHELVLIDGSNTIPANQRVYAHNYSISAISGSAADAIVFEISSGDGSDKISIAAPLIVTGVDLTSGVVGTMVRPDDIDLILYDPPGNGSTAGFASEYTICREVTRKITGSEGNDRDLNVKYGVKGKIGFIIELDFELSTAFTGAYSFSRDSSSTASYNECTTIKNTLTTSGGIYGIGESADLFIGNGERWAWGYRDSIMIDNNCALNIDQQYITSVVDHTRFVWSKNTLDSKIEDIKTDIVNLAGLPNPTDLQKLEKLQKEEQLRIWNDILMDYQNKKSAEGGDSFDWSCGGCTAGASMVTSVTNSRNSEKSIFFEKKQGEDFSATLGGAGVDGGFKINMSKSVSSSITTKNENTTEVSYSYNDGNGGDYHAGRITIDPDYGTHIFHLDGGGTKTSCPYEGGIRRDRPSISASACGENGPFVQNIYIDNADPGNPPSEVIKVKICNQNPSEGRLVSWRIDANPQSLGYQFNGSDNQIDDLGEVAANQCQVIDLVLHQINATTVYSDFIVRVFPTCLRTEESLLLAESDFINVNVTFSAPAVYPDGDDDCDGVINSQDVCPNEPDTDGPDQDGIATCIDLCPEERDVSLHFEDRGGITSDYIEVPHEDDFSLLGNDFAFEAWVNPASGGYKTIVSKGNGSNAETSYIFGIMADDDTFFGEPGKLGLSLTNSFINLSEWQFSDLSIPQNVWTHVAVSVDISGDNPVAIFYVNGDIDAVRPFGEDILSRNLNNLDTNPLFIGRQGYDCQCNHFDGRIDELALWQKQLTAADIQASMAAPYVGTESGLKAYFDFNDNNACVANGNTTLVDKVNGHNGILTNFSLTAGCESNWSSGHNKGACESICPANLDLTNTLSTNQVYSSGGYISSDQIILSPAEVDFNATTEITLLEGFEVKVGAVFHAFIDGCAAALQQIKEAIKSKE